MQSLAVTDPSDAICIFARRGSGKTVLTKEIIKQSPSVKFVVIDFLGTLADLKSMTNVYYYRQEPDPHFIDAIIEYALKNRHRVMFVIEEVDMVRYPVGAQTYKSQIYKLVNQYRNFGIGYLFTFRRISNVPLDLVANAHRYYIFRHTLDRDVNRIEKSVAVEEDQIRNLGDFEFLIVHDDRVLGIGKVEL